MEFSSHFGELLLRSGHRGARAGKRRKKGRECGIIRPLRCLRHCVIRGHSVRIRNESFDQGGGVRVTGRFPSPCVTVRRLLCYLESFHLLSQRFTARVLGVLLDPAKLTERQFELGNQPHAVIGLVERNLGCRTRAECDSRDCGQGSRECSH
jgi:hypothetical protein